MANIKITDLTDIGTPDPLDVLEIVDVSTNTSKKVLVSELGGSGTTPTLQEVTNAGNEITNEIISNTGFRVKSGDTTLSAMFDDGVIYTSGDFRLGDNGISVNTISIKAPSTTGFTLDRSVKLPDESGELVIMLEKLTSFSAKFSVTYSTNGTITVTDPVVLTAESNKGYIVHVVAGTTTIGGVAYTSGALVYRFYDGSSWISKDYGASSSIPNATETVAGIAEIATTAEVTTGTDDERIVTPLKLNAVTNLKVDKTNWIDISETSTIVGFSAFTIKKILYQKINEKTILVKANLSGTSNSNLLNFTIPFTSVNNDTNNLAASGVVNSGVAQAAPGFSTCDQNTNIVNVFRNFTAQPFTATGMKTGQLTILIEIQ